jgi:PII-like signaling protein
MVRYWVELQRRAKELLNIINNPLPKLQSHSGAGITHAVLIDVFETEITAMGSDKGILGYYTDTATSKKYLVSLASNGLLIVECTLVPVE